MNLGINFFDTANVYGQKLGEGVTEHIIGRWFAQNGGRREKTVIATKVYGRMGTWPNQSRLSALNIRQAVDGSLKRLQTDHIDIYQMHHVDRHCPLGRNLAGDGNTCATRQSFVCGFIEFRWLASLSKRRKLQRRVTFWVWSVSKAFTT